MKLKNKSKKKKDTRGVINVFVALMMVPTVAFTGLMLDFARLNMAHSQVQNAAYLAANSALAHYNGLLFEVFGLLGMSMNKEEIEKFGELVAHRSLGFHESGSGTLFGDSFNLFGNASIDVTMGPNGESSDYTLNNLAQLRYQILRYMSLRIAIPLLENFLDNVQSSGLDPNNAETEVRFWEGDFTDILIELGALQVMYRELQATYEEFEGLGENLQNQLDSLNNDIESLQNLQEELVNAEEELEILYDSAYDDDFNSASITQQINQLRAQIRNLEGQIADLERGIKESASNLNSQVLEHKQLLERSEELSKEIDEQMAKVEELIEEAKIKLEEGRGDYFSSVMVDAALDYFEGIFEDDDPPLVLRNSIEVYGVRFREHNESILTELSEKLSAIANDPTSSISLELEFEPYTEDRNSATRIRLELINEGGELSQEEFDEIFDGLGIENPEHIDRERTLIPGDDENDFNVSTIVAPRIMPSHNLKGKNIPLGYQTRVITFGSAENFINNRWINRALRNLGIGIATQTRESVGLSPSDSIGTAGNIADFFINRALLVEYGVQMFSNYTTNRRMVNGELPVLGTETDRRNNGERNLSGIPIDNRMHYLYGAELEFLFAGISDSINRPGISIFWWTIREPQEASAAQRNVDAVMATLSVQFAATNFLFAIRDQEIMKTKKLLKAIPFGIGALAAVSYFLAIVAGETYLDIQTLQAGQRVPIFKTRPEHWRTGRVLPGSNFLGAKNPWGTDPGIVHHPSTADNEGPGLYYYQHLRNLLLIFSAFPGGLDFITNRIAILIELNMNHHLAKQNNASKPKYPDRFSLKETYVLATTEVEVDFRHFFIGGAFLNGERSNNISRTAIRGY